MRLRGHFPKEKNEWEEKDGGKRTRERENKHYSKIMKKKETYL